MSFEPLTSAITVQHSNAPTKRPAPYKPLACYRALNRYRRGQAFDCAQITMFGFSFQTFFSAPLFAFTKIASPHLSSFILHPQLYS